ncbi:MAG: type IV secretion system DNA-binding domain-containing protein [Armatimonadetes bacterium]|nr:type IV secretion system DNA-binding domain-containing protein [Armatimonadota bacterium]MDE2205828.1 type IV secretion system DNA-binding domain-containing protein [Armatimonadota bacterium]
MSEITSEGMLSEVHTRSLREAFCSLLGSPSEGTMAFARCLSPETVAALTAITPLEIPGWEVYGVVGEDVTGARQITADQAIDLREAKRDSILLLVDIHSAGAGIYGIYSAVREIGERDLFTAAIAATKKLLSRTDRSFAEEACRRGRRLGRLNAISPWREFDFYASCAGNPSSIGAEVSRLGLWPIANREGGSKSEDLERSAVIVERLLLSSSATLTARARVDTLLLPAEDRVRAVELEKFLRDTDGLRWTDAILRARYHPAVWLNAINPGFDSQQLKSIEIVSWRSRPDADPLKWSGLRCGPEGVLQFILSVDERESEQCRLTVRWKVAPPGLDAGAITYKIAVVTGQRSELASREVSHTGKETQQCVFSGADFADLDTDGKWEVKIVVHPVGESEPSPFDERDSLRWKESEEFILQFGHSDDPHAAVGLGRRVRALVEEAVKLNQDEFALACTTSITEDRQSCIGYRIAGRSARVFRPPMLRAIEEEWYARDGRAGRWRVRVREDGTPLRPPEFVEMSQQALQDSSWRRMEDTSRLLSQRAKGRGGLLGLIHHDSERTTDYVNAWATALEAALSAGREDLTLVHTLEVQSLDGTVRGLIVLPSHPLRIAWHQAYDELGYYMRYQEKLKAAEVVKTLHELDGSFIPAFLPGLNMGEVFVFGDTLGFYTVAMTLHDEPEPQATIALLARCLASSREEFALSVGSTAAQALSREITKYADLHDEFDPLHIHALRPGDGFMVAQALGQTLRPNELSGRPIDDIDDESNEARVAAVPTGRLTGPGFRLNLFPSAASRDASLSGRFLAEIAERRRAGAGAVPAEDRWMLETYEKEGITQPRLKWARRDHSEPREPAHLALAFDTFDSSIETVPVSSLHEARPLEAFGMVPGIARVFSFRPTPTWITMVAPNVDGEKHPHARVLTDRLLRLHAVILRLVAANLGGGVDSWPTLKTHISADKADSVRRLHELSDWVVTVDRNAGIEYFDAPKEAGDIYETYVIDCVPERQDLDFIQLVTSTSKIDEVMRLLDRALADMNLSSSPRNCAFLLDRLKAISGRLAMRFSSRGSDRGELISLALFADNCLRADDDLAVWPSLFRGFLVPLDDVRDLLFGDGRIPQGEFYESAEQPGHLRADLVHISTSRRGLLQFQFIEVKYRRLLRSALDPALRAYIRKQLGHTRQQWMQSYFSPTLSPTQAAIRRKKLARALRFYADKARRHSLNEEGHKRILTAIDRLYRSDAEVSGDVLEDRGYIFCPERSGGAMEVDFDGASRIYLFGHEGMPDAVPSAAFIPIAPSTAEPLVAIPHSYGIGDESIDASSQVHDMEGTSARVGPDHSLDLALPDHQSEDSAEIHPQSDLAAPFQLGAGSLLLGNAFVGGTRVNWNVSVHSNPHLMIVGQPGTGKTYCLVRLCRQLRKLGIAPVIFDFHGDIEERLASEGETLRFSDLEKGIGFNPMRVVRTGENAWIDNVADLRDIFAAIYPDLGDLQTHEIREAIKESYRECGFGQSTGMSSPGIQEPPSFQRFYDILTEKPKPNIGVLARLGELNDYGFFRNTDSPSTLLDTRDPTIVRLYRTQNEVLQNALASFVLFNLYQNMFLRGPQHTLTHSILFDEAHRASHLKLIPTMAKECRKYGLAMIVASQEAKDFNVSLFSAISNYLILRVTEIDAKFLARTVGANAETHALASRLKSLADRTALFFSPGKRPTGIELQE